MADRRCAPLIPLLNDIAAARCGTAEEIAARRARIMGALRAAGLRQAEVERLAGLILEEEPPCTTSTPTG